MCLEMNTEHWLNATERKIRKCSEKNLTTARFSNTQPYGLGWSQTWLSAVISQQLSGIEGV